jgi:hypothetical protein
MSCPSCGVVEAPLRASGKMLGGKRDLTTAASFIETSTTANANSRPQHVLFHHQTQLQHPHTNTNKCHASQHGHRSASVRRPAQSTEERHSQRLRCHHLSDIGDQLVRPRRLEASTYLPEVGSSLCRRRRNRGCRLQISQNLQARPHLPNRLRL